MNNKKPGRPLGSSNKPKFISVPVKDIVSIFSEDAIINIDIKYAKLFGKQERIILNTPTSGFSDSKIEVKKVIFQ
jgi:hypothetical protein